MLVTKPLQSISQIADEELQGHFTARQQCKAIVVDL